MNGRTDGNIDIANVTWPLSRFALTSSSSPIDFVIHGWLAADREELFESKIVLLMI